MKKIIAVLGILASLATAAPAMAQSVVPTYATVSGYASAYTTGSGMAYCPALSFNLYFGLRDYYTQGQVSALQEFLAARGYSQPVTGYFGGVTRNNVARFQQQYSIYPITGGVGPITRGVISQQCGSYNPGTNGLSISNISGPTSLSVGQTGTWAITTNAPYGSYMSTSVHWGDEGYYPYNTASAAQSYVSGQTSLSHTYSQAGTYTITFTVTDSYGHTANASQTVVVGGGSAYQTPVITSVTPNQGSVGTTVTIQGYGFGQNNTVYFGNGGTQNVPSYNGTSISYTIPLSIGAVCAAGQVCPMYLQLVTPGTYNISVANGYGQSSSVPFVVTSGGTVGGLTVTSPSQGQTYSRGQDMTISWNYPVTPGSTQVMMELYSTSGSRIGLIAVSSNTVGSYTWHIPAFPQNYMCTLQYPNGLCGTNIPDGQYYVKVSASNNPLDSNPTVIASGQSGTFNMTGAGTTNSGLSASPMSGNAPLTVTFSPSSIPGGYWSIQFGDGTSANLLTSSVTHTYSSRGTYTASATTDLPCLHSTPQCYTFAAQQSLGSATINVY
jgi:PKD repeat protein